MAITNNDLIVRPATEADAGRLIAVLAEAFHDGPVADWLIPHPEPRRAVYYRYFRDAFHHGLAHGEVYTTDDQSAVAIWYPHLEPAPTDPHHRLQTLETIAGAHAPKFVLLEEMFEAFHPDEPHHHLAYVAVAPQRQNHGIGAALLDRYHRRLDRLGLPAYLEATNMRNRQLYLRLGYTVGPTMALPTHGPTIWRMWRGALNATRRSPFPPTRPRRRSL
ncbi:GNAT family N-acetyltransferase [Micromonospora endophytica]|uniref:GNAT family N-acetyltransferase n=1 Tax=Micromonospora endophytica TaxID=515350 RepID=A0A2W2D157_9ACTN|nr:GNAT family N-acetyltransferase [Micromonospora endophytica]PZF99384.1 GNAT family N-acetyltransferase [Micromonospora endophytica]RIW42907.1 N-acetyltransferase [Micromonospora endophytica]BCJ61571.1 N-acetyltransferase [Micromonospora endophytica]